jgi:hypothetical protein
MSLGGIMFENGIESQQNTGLRGLLNRHFGTIDTPEHAFKAVRTIAKFFLWFAAITGVISLILFGLPALFDAIIYAGLGFWLLRRQSRVAACLLTFFAAINFLFTLMNLLSMSSSGGKNIFLAIVIMAVASRATYATFRFHGKWKESGSSNQSNFEPDKKEMAISGK